MLLIFEISSELPVAPAALVDAVLASSAWPHSSAETDGSRPEAERNSIVASTRRSISPAWMSRRPQL